MQKSMSKNDRCPSCGHGESGVWTMMAMKTMLMKCRRWLHSGVSTMKLRLKAPLHGDTVSMSCRARCRRMCSHHAHTRVATDLVEPTLAHEPEARKKSARATPSCDQSCVSFVVARLDRRLLLSGGSRLVTASTMLVVPAHERCSFGTKQPPVLP